MYWHVLRGGGISFNDVLSWITCGFSVLYYVALIIQYYLLIPWLQKLPTRLLVVSSAVVSLVSILLVTYLRSYRDVSVPLILYAGICPLWIVFYSLGIALSRGNREYRLWPLIILLVISLVLQFFGTTLLSNHRGPYVGIKPSSFLFSAMMVLSLFSKRVEDYINQDKGIFYNLLAGLGKNSFGVYLSHMVVYLLLRCFCHINLWFLRWFILLILDVLLILLLKRVLPQSLNKYLGL